MDERDSKLTAPAVVPAVAPADDDVQRAPAGPQDPPADPDEPMNPA